MRLGGFLFVIAMSPSLGACDLPSDEVMACSDGVSVHFPAGRAELNLDAAGKVLVIVSTLNACPAARATITGHADKAEQPALAAVRAANVASVIIKNGIDRRRLTVADTGSGQQPHGKPDNRFVSISWR